MNQTELFHETVSDALKSTVSALGGLKVVGSHLWPEKPVDEASRHLSDCLNPDRPHRLDPEHLLLLLKLARQKGVHLAMTWIAEDVGYQVQPLEPVDELAELQRQFIAAAQRVEAISKRIERVQIRAAS